MPNRGVPSVMFCRGAMLALALSVFFACSACSGDDAPALADASADAGLDATASDSGGDAGPRLPILPVETADDAALALFDWAALPVLGTGRYVQSSSYDRGVSAAPPLPILANGNRDLDNFVCRSAGATPAESALVSYSFDEPECSDARGFVIARFEGSGALARVWMTAFAALSNEVMRIYVDGAAEPAIEVRLRDAWDGTAGEVFAPPFGAGTATYMAWHYPVVFSSKLVVALDRLGTVNAYYYQVGAVLDATPRSRVAPSAVSPLRASARTALTSTPPVFAELASTPPTVVGAGATVGLADIAGPATVRSLELTVARVALPSLAEVSIDVSWDDDATPAISVPIAELFAAGLAPAAGPTAVVDSRAEGDDVVLVLRLPMPFMTHAVLAATNRSLAPVTLALRVRGEATVPSAPFGRLSVVRSETRTGGAMRHPVVDVSDRGRLAGVCFMLEGHALESLGTSASGFNFLEGDELGLVDGERALVGTGTEDYLDSAFYFRDGPHATPFAQVWDIALDTSAVPETGRVSACRWHVLGDAIDFDRELRLDIEIGPGAPETRDRYRTIAFVYR